MLTLTLLLPHGALAQTDQRPYDEPLLRLSEVLGSIHYLRALCGHEDGQTWRLHMEELLTAEGSTPRRRAVLAQRFNQGYRNYSRTYRRCTVSAKAALQRFLEDALTNVASIQDTGRPARRPTLDQRR
ncbi:MAG: TIGR02301 family protein [Hyphomicrobiaceae bacterium]